MQDGPARITDDLYHYTSAEVGVDSVLCQMQFRMGLIESTNDPRESRPHYPTLAGSPKDDDKDLFPLWTEADNLLRRSAKVGCFTLDWEVPDTVIPPEIHRGYAHPALWAHYGGRHAGVCLRFSRSRLSARIRETVGDRGSCFEGPVEYVADPLQDMIPCLLDLEQIQEYGLDAVVARSIERNHRALFFRKHRDWSSEREYRWVWIDPGALPLYVDIGGCVTGVVLGDAFPRPRLSAVHALARDQGFDITQVHFDRGQPRLLPAPESEKRFQLAPRRPGPYEDRVRALADAESARETARSHAEEITAPLLQDVYTAVQRIVDEAGNLTAADVAFHQSVQAIPPAERRLAAGVSEQSSVYDRGAMCVVEALPKYSLTLVFAVAVQVLPDESIRLHAAIELERWLPTGNTQEQLWRPPVVIGSLKECRAAVARILSETSAAFQTFEKARSYSE